MAAVEKRPCRGAVLRSAASGARAGEVLLCAGSTTGREIARQDGPFWQTDGGVSHAPPHGRALPATPSQCSIRACCIECCPAEPHSTAQGSGCLYCRPNPADVCASTRIVAAETQEY